MPIFNFVLGNGCVFQSCSEEPVLHIIYFTSLGMSIPLKVGEVMKIQFSSDNSEPVVEIDFLDGDEGEVRVFIDSIDAEINYEIFEKYDSYLKAMFS